MEMTVMPVRILHVVTYMDRGGLETMIMNYYRHMDRSKVQFDFLVHREFRADYDDEIEALGGKIYRIPRLVPWNRRYQQALKDFFKEHTEYKIVHVHQDCMSSVILKAAKKQGVPVRIAHSHSSSQDKNLKYLIKMYYRGQIARYATHLLACGKEAGDWMFCGAPYGVLNNAIDSRRYVYDAECRQRVRESLQIADDTFVVGHIGRFMAVKNHAFLLEVFAKVKEQKNNSVLLLVGDGEQRAEIEAKVATLGIEGSVIFTGVRDDVPELLQAMDCFALPSWYEGVPVTLIEAQAAGLSCVVSTGVPVECAKTDLVEHLELSKGAAFWAEKILGKEGLPRKNTREDIAQVGYDIETNAKWLQEFYLEQWKKRA